MRCASRGQRGAGGRSPGLHATPQPRHPFLVLSALWVEGEERLSVGRCWAVLQMNRKPHARPAALSSEEVTVMHGSFLWPQRRSVHTGVRLPASVAPPSQPSRPRSQKDAGVAEGESASHRTWVWFSQQGCAPFRVQGHISPSHNFNSLLPASK